MPVTRIREVNSMAGVKPSGGKKPAKKKPAR